MPANHLPNRSAASSTLLYAILATAVLAPIGLAIPYTLPTYDDYYYAYRTSLEGFWGVQAWWYLNASGRYLSNLLLSAGVTLIHHTYAYRLLLVVFLLLLLLTLHRLSTGLVRKSIPATGIPPVGLTVITIAFFLQVTAGFSEFLFWYTGAGTYSIGISLILLFMSELFLEPGRSRPTRLTLLMLASLLACGTIEFAGLFVAAALVYYFFLSIRNDRAGMYKRLLSPETIVLLAVGCTMLFIIAGAQGNRIRLQAEMVENGSAGNVRFALRQGGLGMVMFIYNILWVRGGVFLFLFTLLSATYWRNDGRARPDTTGLRWTDWLVAQVLLVGLTLAISVMYCYSTGVSTMIPRTLSIPAFFWSLNIVISAVLLADIIPFPRPTPIRKFGSALGIAPAAFLIFLIAFSPTSNIHRLYADHISGRVAAYRDFTLNQTALFARCDEDGLRKLELPAKPMTFVWDISDGNLDTRYFEYYWEALCGKPWKKPVP